MYNPGEVMITTEYYGNRDKVIALPHSCDEWVIGSPDDARNLIKDLEKAIEEFPNASV